MNGMIRVVLCDDVAELRRLMREVLEEHADVEVVEEVGTGRECVRVVTERKPDVLLLDLSMPDMDGLEALPVIVERSPNTRIVVFSGFAADRMAALAMERGADLYFEKGMSLDALAEEVRALARTTDDGAERRVSDDADGGPGGRGHRLMSVRLIRRLVLL